MSKKQKNETSAKAPVKLTRAEKKEIQAVIRKYKGDGKPHSAQASIPYEAMYQDGVCRVTPRTFSKCIEFTDISYQLAQADTKTAIFENLCDLYNYLDASIHVQFSFINRKIDPKQYAKSFEIRAQGDDFDDIRSEYSDILQDQLVNGNNGLMKRKFMTYTIEADSLKMARARLRRIETDLLGYFKSMGASAWGLDAKERLEVMHSIFHPDGEPFSFDWKWLAPSGLSTKDFIAPSSFRFGNARMFGLGGKYGAVSFLQILSPELSDEMLADFLNTENGIVVNLHVQAIDQSDAIKTVKRKITDLDAMKIQEQKRAVRSGYDMDKQHIKREYAKAARAAGQTAQGAASTAKTTAAAAKKAAEKSRQAASFAARHWKGALIVGGVGLMLLLVMGGLQSCTAMFGSTGTVLAATSYLSEDSDMLGAEAAYAALEADLQHELDNYESLHPGYDEYRFDLDEIKHDPYVLTSILSALHNGVFTLGEVQGDLAMLFEKQYILTQTIETETRYRTETRTDSEGNTYTVEVPYTYYICHVKLENFDLSHLPIYILTEEQMGFYAAYMQTLGNRPDLFPNGSYPHASTPKEPTYYEIPPEALKDEAFAAMIAEAEKYVGYP